MAKTTMGVRLSEDIQRRLELLGKQKDRTPHYLMKTAIERFIESEEALEEERQLLQSRWQKYALTGETVDHEEIRSWAMGLGDAEDNA